MLVGWTFLSVVRFPSGAEYENLVMTMTELEWLNSADPQTLINFLLQKQLATERQLRLLACACCRHAWDRLPRAGRTAIETAERFADGCASAADLIAAAAAFELSGLESTAAAWTTVFESRYSVDSALSLLGQAAAAAPESFFVPARWEAERRRQADLVREIFGNPFQPSDRSADHLTWEDGVARQLAAAIYEGRCFDDLPILADALEEAGCTSAAILAHCRQPDQVHARGCWVLDTVLAKP
jgi:hypothetical protein